MPSQTNRRDLQFKNFDAVRNDTQTLLRTGYDRAGNWDLSQVCGHLAAWLTYPIDGPPPQPPHRAMMFWLVRNTIGGMIVRHILRTGAMPAGSSTLKSSIPAAGGEETQAVANLQSAISRFEKHTGPWHPSPLFGTLDRDQRTRLQLIHCAHHLSFLNPKPDNH
jgi:hypothetical protein